MPGGAERAFANLNLREPEKRWKEKAEKSERGGPRSDASFAAEAFSPSVGNVECAIDSPAQRRARLRLLAEAHLVGAVASAKPAFAAVTELIRSADFARDKERFAHVLASLAAFAKTYGEAFVREEEEDDGHEIEANEKDGETFAARDAKEKEKEKEKPYRLSRAKRRVSRRPAAVPRRRERGAAGRAPRGARCRARDEGGAGADGRALRVAHASRRRAREVARVSRKNLEVLTEALGGERARRMPPDVDDEKAGDGKPKGDAVCRAAWTRARRGSTPRPGTTRPPAPSREPPRVA